uniref:Uncharacterized protein n=1 Tax=Oryza barthii TaxID=65489 RepID=A0A0D3EQC8_9ORYZ
MGRCGHPGEKKGEEKEKEEEEEGKGDGRMTCGSLCDFGDITAEFLPWIPYTYYYYFCGRGYGGGDGPPPGHTCLQALRLDNSANGENP